MSFTLTGNEDPDFDLARFIDLQVVGENPPVPPPSDVFSSAMPTIDDSPEAAAAFDNFVTELNEVPSATPSLDSHSGSAAQDFESMHVFQLNSPANTALSSSAASRANALSSNSFFSAMMASGSNSNNADEYPNRLDFNSLAPYGLPLNAGHIAAIHSGAMNIRPFPALIPDAGTFSSHPVQTPSHHSWEEQRRSELITQARNPQQTTATRERAKSRELKNVPERNSTVGASGGVPSNSNSPAKLRYSKGAAPSKYCHVCGRSAKTVSVALCGNNRLGLCRKVVCDKCLLMHQRDSWEVAKRGDGNWICMHCRNSCPERARCHQYQRNNLKRRMRGTGASPSRTDPFHPRSGRVVKGSVKPSCRVLPAASSAKTSANLMTNVDNCSNGTETDRLFAPNGNGSAELGEANQSSIPSRNVSGMQATGMAEIGAHFLGSPIEEKKTESNSSEEAQKTEAHKETHTMS